MDAEVRAQKTAPREEGRQAGDALPGAVPDSLHTQLAAVIEDALHASMCNCETRPVPLYITRAAEAVIDALRCEQAGWNPKDGTSLYPMEGRPAGVMDEDGAWWPATCVWLPVFRLGVLSLPPQKETA